MEMQGRRRSDRAGQSQQPGHVLTCTSTSGEVHRVGERSRALMRWVGDSFAISTVTFTDQPVLLQRGSLDGKEVKNENFNSPDEKFQNLTNKYQPNTT